MKKFYFLLTFIFSLTQLYAAKDSQCVIVCGTGTYASYKNNIALEQTCIISDFLKKFEGIAVLDVNSEIYKFYNYDLTQSGPSYKEIITYCNNIGNIDLKCIFVYDISTIEGVTYITLRVLHDSDDIYNKRIQRKFSSYNDLLKSINSLTSECLKEIMSEK